MWSGMWDGMAIFISDITYYISNDDSSYVDSLTTTSLIGHHDSIKFARRAYTPTINIELGGSLLRR